MFNNSVGMPQDLKLTQYQNNNVKLSWKAPAEGGNYLYAVYRKQGTGAVTLLTLKPSALTEYTDNLTSLGKRTYFVKALKLGTSRSGSFYYSSNPITSEIDVVGVEETNPVAVNIFPNPTSEMLNISFISSGNNSIVEIMDLESNVVNLFHFESSNGVSNRIVWNLTNSDGHKVTPGVYFIKISSGKNVILEKVIIH
jgi:hypothetical protein